MPRHCVAVGCDSVGRKGCSLYKFPHDEAIRTFARSSNYLEPTSTSLRNNNKNQSACYIDNSYVHIPGSIVVNPCIHALQWLTVQLKQALWNSGCVVIQVTDGSPTSRHWILSISLQQMDHSRAVSIEWQWPHEHLKFGSIFGSIYKLAWTIAIFLTYQLVFPTRSGLNLPNSPWTTLPPWPMDLLSDVTC